MLKTKLKYLAIGIATTLSFPSAHAATSITVAATPAMANTLADIVSDFQNQYSTSGYSVAVAVDLDVNIRDAVVSGGAMGPYDIFLSESALLPLQLLLKYPTLAPGPVFPYARDTLVLYSSSTSVDISAGLPSSGVKAFALPDPKTLDPWGVAAGQVIFQDWAALTAYRQGLGTLVPDAATSFAEAEYLNVPYAFTGKSQVCTLFNGVEQYEVGSFHHEYKLGKDYFNDIVLAGIKIARTRTADQETEATNFVNFLRGVGATVGTNTLKSHCLKLP